MRPIDEVTGIIVDAAYRIHTGLGPGLLESVYEVVLARELERNGLRVERQRVVSFEFDGILFLDAFRVDLLVEESVVVELKSVEETIPLHGKQLLTYLRLMNLNVGLLINFGAATLKEGLKRVVNKYSGPEAFAARGNAPRSNRPHEDLHAETLSRRDEKQEL
jgi:GxxExxY protein